MLAFLVAAASLAPRPIDPWHMPLWSRAPEMVAKLQAFSHKNTVGPFLDEVQRRGIRQALVSWEYLPVARLAPRLRALSRGSIRDGRR
jgi:hypothetical protein